jgi:O-antigen/teichoic acid export membrane protein
VGDQSLVAVANFWLTVTIGRAFTPGELAAYGIGLSAGLMVQALQRHTFVIPLLLQRQSVALRRAGGLLAQHWMMLIFVGSLTGAVFIGARLAGASYYIQTILGASGVCFLVFAELEFARAMVTKLNRPLLLLLGALYYAGLCGIAGYMALMGWMNFVQVLVWLAAGAVVHAIGVSICVGEFHFVLGWRILAQNLRRYGAWSIVAMATYSGYNQVPLFILAAVSAPYHAAVFVAARGLLQPLQILLRGMDIADKALFAECAQAAEQREAFALTLKIACLYGAASLSFGLLVAIFADSLLELAYGSKFAGESGVLIAWIPVFTLVGCMMPLESLIYARQAFRGYYIARAAGAVAAIGLTLPLTSALGASGTVLSCAAGALLAIIGTLLLLQRGTVR